MNYNMENVNEQIVLLRKQEFNQREIAERLNTTRDKVRYTLEKAGMQNFKYKRKCKNCGIKYETVVQASKFCEERCRNEYNRNRRGAKQKCNWCDKEFKSYKIRKHCSSKCREKERKDTRERKCLVERLIKAIDPNRQKRCKGCGKVFYAHAMDKEYCNDKCWYIANYKPERHNHVCRECGKHYTDNIRNSAGCSDRCKRRYKNRVDEINRRNRLRKNGKIDWDISVERLIKRDKGICHICNNKVDKNDYTIDDNHYFIAGNNYPSIDHVIPVSKGGTHTWDNVKLAHRICNTEKGNDMMD